MKKQVYWASVFRIWETDQQIIAHLESSTYPGYFVERFYGMGEKIEIGQRLMLNDEEVKEIQRKMEH